MKKRLAARLRLLQRSHTPWLDSGDGKADDKRWGQEKEMKRGGVGREDRLFVKYYPGTTNRPRKGRAQVT